VVNGVVAAETAGVIRVEQIMGMPIVVDVRDVDDAEALEPLFDWFRLVDQTFSTYIPGSEISRLGRGELSLDEAADDVRDILARCEELRAPTNGYFDARAAGNGLDPSGLVKGWSVDRAAAIADEIGWRNYAINAGGDLRLRGGALPVPVWRVGIQHPGDRREVVAVVTGDDLAVATSGAYARGPHVVDPHQGLPPEGVLSVTITGPDLATADAYATAAFAMGLEGPAWTARLRGYEALTLLADGRTLRTPGFGSSAGRTAENHWNGARAETYG
jgi:thiamine biosynthesis lipoprotein